MKHPPMLLAVVSLVSLAGPLAASRADAHSVLLSPEPRETGMEGSALKMRPCGMGTTEERSQTVTSLQAGQVVTVRWQETIPHPGYFRIAFDQDGWDFQDPPTPRATGYSQAVLADVIYPSTPAEAQARWENDENLYAFDVTLPDVACDRCTLQLIQFMEDKLQDGDPDNDIYYSCADLVLVKASPDPGTAADEAGAEDASIDTPAAVTDTGTEISGVGSSGACSAGNRPAAGAWLALLLVVPAIAGARRLRRHTASTRAVNT